MQKKHAKKKNEGYQEILNFDNPVYKFVPEGRHKWRQQGPYLVCYGCDLKHAVWIGMELMMVGEAEDGKPILKRR